MLKNRSKLSPSNLKQQDHVLVYSTEPVKEKLCDNCKQTLSKCSCNQFDLKTYGPIQPLLQIEKKGRAGKIVTLLKRLPTDDKFLKDLCAHLKRTLGSGGTHYIKNNDGIVEIQGDWRKDILEITQKFLNS